MEVLDEPLYANFLRVTGTPRPYREELLARMVSPIKSIPIELSVYSMLNYRS